MKFVGVIGLICTLACHHPARDDSPVALSSEDSVYYAVLAQEAQSLSPKEQLLVAGEIPTLFASDEAARAWVDSGRALMAAVSPSTLLSFALANRVPRHVDLPPRLADHRVVVTSAMPADVHADAVVQLSRAAFSARADSAVLMFTRHCGPLCGSSRLLLTVRDTAGWRVARTLWQASF